MPTWIALFRGINVGGHRKLPMAELREQLESLGLEEVRTYIQSGNVVFRSAESDSGELGEAIASLVEEHHGFRPRVLVLSRDELLAAMRANPFTEDEVEPVALHLFFLTAPPKEPRIAAIESALAPSERYLLSDKVFYLHAPDGIGRSKLAAAAERYLGVEATARNGRTVGKLAEMAGE